MAIREMDPPLSMEELKPNSHQYHKDAEQNDISKPEEEKPKAELSGNVTTKKRPLWKRVLNTFLKDGASPKEIKTYILEEVIVPAVLDNISDVITTAVEMRFFGAPKRGGGSKGGSSGNNSKINYGGFFNDGSRRRERLAKEAKKDTGTRELLDDYIFDNKGDAEMVLVEMRELLDRFQQVTVMDYLDILTNYGISVNTTPSDSKYGWTDLSDVEPTRTRGGYYLNLPKERLL